MTPPQGAGVIADLPGGRAACMPPLQNSVNGRLVGDAYMRPVDVAVAVHFPGAVKTAPYKAPVHAIL